MWPVFSPRQKWFPQVFSVWLCWVLVAAGLFSGRSKQGLLSSCGVRASHWGGFPCCGAWAPGHGLQ